MAPCCLCLLLLILAEPVSSLASRPNRVARTAAPVAALRRGSDGMAAPEPMPVPWPPSPDSTTARHESGLSRRRLLLAAPVASALVTAIAAAPATVRAAPPIAVIAEELGYFPVQDREGRVRYVPRRVARASSEQAVALARRLAERGVVMAGTYWCPHTGRQKELFGREAWALVPYVECSPQGYGADPRFCSRNRVDGYPTWIFPDGRQLGGERPLSVLAQEVGFTGFRDDLELNLPPMMGSQACPMS